MGIAKSSGLPLVASAAAKLETMSTTLPFGNYGLLK
jgi:hypothetical protein